MNLKLNFDLIFRQLVLIASLLISSICFAADQQKHRILVIGGIHQSNAETYSDNLKAMLWTIAVVVAKDISREIAKKDYVTFEYISDNPQTWRNYVGNEKKKVDDCSCTLAIFVKLESDPLQPNKQFLLNFFAVPESKGLIYLEPMLNTSVWYSSFTIQFSEMGRYKEISSKIMEQLIIRKILIKN